MIFHFGFFRGTIEEVGQWSNLPWVLGFAERDRERNQVRQGENNERESYAALIGHETRRDETRRNETRRDETRRRQQMEN
jgi:hypothetical protein